jgi:phenylacetate-CoA ligase
MKQKIVEKIILSLVYKLRNEKVFSYLQNYKRLDNMKFKDLQRYKIEKLMALFNYVKDEIPFYSSLMKNRKRCSFTELNEFPILTKSEIKNNIGQYISNKEKVSWRSTSGSIGEPFIFPKDRKATAHMDSVMYHVYSWHCVKPGDRQARIWGSATKIDQKVIEILKDFLLNRKRLSAFEINEYNCKKYYFLLRNFKPKFIYCYPNPNRLE